MASPAFTPPPLSSWQPPSSTAPPSATTPFTPPPLSSWQAPEEDHPLSGIPSVVSNWWDQVHHGPLNLYDVGKGVAGLATGDTEKSMASQTGKLYQKMKDAYNAGDYIGAAFHGLNYALSGIPGVSSVIDDAGEDFKNGQPMAGTGKVLGLLTNAGIGAKLPAIAEGVSDAPAAVSGAVQRALPGGGDPITTFIQGVKPRASILKFRQNLESSGMGDAKLGESLTGKPVKSVADALYAVKAAKIANRAAYAPFGGENRARIPVDLSPAADAMDSSIPATLAHEASQGVPSAVSELSKRWAQSRAYRTTVPLEQAEAMLRDANADLDAFYAKYPRQQWSSLQTNPETAATYAKAQSLRDAVYSALDNYGAGDAARSINQRYGNLLEIEGELQRRQNIAARQQPQSLAEQVSKAQAIGHGVVGGLKIVSGMAPASGLVDIAGALAQKRAAAWLRDQQTSDAMVARAFKNYKGSTKPFPKYENPRVAGLLGTGPIITPPPADASFVHGVPAMAEPPNPARALPAVTTRFAGPVADPSGVTAVPAAPPFRVGFPQKALPAASNQALNQEIGSSHGDIVGPLQPPKLPINPYSSNPYK